MTFAVVAHIQYTQMTLVSNAFGTQQVVEYENRDEWADALDISVAELREVMDQELEQTILDRLRDTIPDEKPSPVSSIDQLSDEYLLAELDTLDTKEGMILKVLNNREEVYVHSMTHGVILEVTTSAANAELQSDLQELRQAIGDTHQTLQQTEEDAEIETALQSIERADDYAHQIESKLGLEVLTQSVTKQPPQSEENLSGKQIVIEGNDAESQAEESDGKVNVEKPSEQD
ncbi:hypothetical protein K0C01_07355 [Salinarchaeum sp. IM2453]|uniref:hypothetical protein n=1 Tax=Salinarchaeum sp. IM2453 TaxID=2862870 RepID=UPI001C832B63|nr:hypothetical protein [Salinarchaeum sp. IM2453]QZA87627.1 hypothetical protein K0C01_07355 [Salinarchaeum sp. IM2453]